MTKNWKNPSTVNWKNVNKYSGEKKYIYSCMYMWNTTQQ